MEKITTKELKLLKKHVAEMGNSDEQFIFMIFKNKDGIDNITQYSFNISVSKIRYYLGEAINSGEIREC